MMFMALGMRQADEGETSSHWGRGTVTVLKGNFDVASCEFGVAL